MKHYARKLVCVIAAVVLILCAAFPVFAEGEPATVNAEMDIDAIQQIVTENDSITFEAGTYKGLSLDITGTKNSGFFTAYDPNSADCLYEYRYDADGKAYVWTPVSIVHYDATEGTLSAMDDSSAQASFVSLSNSRGDGTKLLNESDDSNPALWLCLASFALVGCAIVLYRLCKRRISFR